MKRALNTRHLSKTSQLIISLLSVVVISGICFISTDLIGYKTVALILLLTVSTLAMLFDILPVMVSAIVSALIWNYFFIPPLFTFHVDNTEDLLLFIMYFVIAFVNAVLTFKIRQAEKTARDREEKANAIQLYNTLINSLSHEMRTPLAAIIGSIDTLKENDTKLSSSQKQQLLEEIEKAGTRLNRHVENLLNQNRLESGMLQLKKDWCDINDLIFSLIRKISDYPHQEIIFHPSDQLPLFKIDIGLMEQVIHNVLHNAIQYSPPDSIIRIEAAYENEQLCISVTDEGPGIPDSHTTDIFRKFYRLPQSRTGGTGLGLSIAKGITEAHQGTIACNNNSNGKGTTFTLLIPAETSFLPRLKNE
ncbi:MAG: ATP-binding protein [Bacteroidia bacterium]